MKTVGSILREAREKKHVTFEQAELATKIRLKFLEAIEADDYTKLPSLTYAKGFVQNYSEYLGLDRTHVLAFFRRQSRETPGSLLLPNKEDHVLSRAPLRMTPRRFLMLIVTSLVVLFAGYLALQYAALQRPPILSLESPRENIVTSDKRIDIIGKTDPDATVTINNISVLIRKDGKFFDQVALEHGVNKIIITAASRYGKTTTIERDVGLQSQEK